MLEKDMTFLTVDEVAKHARVSKMTIYRLVRDGTLTSVRVGRSIRIRTDSVQSYFNEKGILSNESL